jgi:hypothetical protein
VVPVEGVAAGDGAAGWVATAGGAADTGTAVGASPVNVMPTARAVAIVRDRIMKVRFLSEGYANTY